MDEQLNLIFNKISMSMSVIDKGAVLGASIQDQARTILSDALTELKEYKGNQENQQKQDRYYN